MSITIKQALQQAYEQLNKAGIKTARLDAELILSFVLKKNKEFFYTYPEQQIKKSKNQEIKKLAKKRTTNYPIAYLTEKKEFFGLSFYVNKNVLIPRPETEALVEETINEIQNSKTKIKNIADMGTGSGCIAVAIANAMKTQLIAPLHTHVYATDISKTALVVAEINARAHNVKSRITFLHGNLLKPIKKKKIDLLIANLPYLDTDYKSLLKSSDQKSLKFEPSLALYSGQDGLDHYHDFFEQISQLEFKPKLILIEFGPKQKIALKKIIKKHLPKANILALKNQPGAFRIELTEKQKN